MLIQSWIDVTTIALQDLWQSFIYSLPNIFGAFIILIVGWIVALGLEGLTVRIINFLKINRLLEKFGVDKLLNRAELKLDFGRFCGFIVKWFIILAFLMAAADILKLAAVTDFLRGILFYLPNIVATVFILLITVWAADFLPRLAKASVAAVTSVKQVGIISLAIRWAVLVFGILAAIDQLGVAPMIVQSLVTGLIAMLAIAGGLAFGLGGKDAAASLINEVKKELAE